MSEFEWISIIFTLMVGLGSIITWVISQERIKRTEEIATKANQIAEKALRLEQFKFQYNSFQDIIQKLKNLHSKCKLSGQNLDHAESYAKMVSSYNEMGEFLIGLEFEMVIVDNPLLIKLVREINSMEFHFHLSARDFTKKLTTKSLSKEDFEALSKEAQGIISLCLLLIAGLSTKNDEMEEKVGKMMSEMLEKIDNQILESRKKLNDLIGSLLTALVDQMKSAIN